MLNKTAFLLLSVLLISDIKVAGQESNNIDSIVQAAASAFMSNPSRVGLSVGVSFNGKTHTSHYGTTEKGKKSSPSNATLYEIGSITKTITGMLLAKAVIDKKVKLEDDVQQYLKGDYANLEYNGSPVRLVHLLNHSSGLPFMLPDKPELFKNPNYDSLSFILSAIEKKYTRQQFFEDLKKVKLDTVPGIKLKYSNAAAQLLAYILEMVYGSSYGELVRKFVSGPLGMPDTKLGPLQKDEKNLAKGYNGNGISMPYTNSGAAGGINSTIADMVAYARFHLDEKNPLVSLSHKPTWGDIQYYASGLNWQMQAKANQPRRIFQSGGTAGFSSFMVIYPDLNVGIVLLSNESDQNSQGALSQAAEAILDKLMKP